MNKKFLFLFLLLSFFVIPKNTYALNKSFEVNGVTYTTDSVQNTMGYFYYTYIKDNQDVSSDNLVYALDWTSSSGYVFLYFDKTTYNFVNYNNNRNIIFYKSNYNCVYKESTDTNTCVDLTGNANQLEINNNIYTNYDWVDSGNIFLLSNIDNATIESWYNNSSGGDVNIDFPINKEEYYCLLLLISTLIIMLFFKWCFPFRSGGRKL